MKAFVVVAALAVVASAAPLPAGEDCDCDPEIDVAAPAGLFGAPGPLAAGPIALKSFKGAAAFAGLRAYGGAISSFAAPAALAVQAPALGYGYAALAPAAVAVQAAPAITYAASAPAIIKQNIEIPIRKTVHYADQQIVTGHTTTIHKPTIAAPAIAAPRTLIGKTITNPATISVQKYAAEVKTINHVPQPYDVPYDVPVPYGVPTPVHTAPVHLKKRVYAPAAYAAPVVAHAPVAYAAHAPVAYAAHAPAAYAAPASLAYAGPAAGAFGAFPASLGLSGGLKLGTYAAATAENLEDCDCD